MKNKSTKNVILSAVSIVLLVAVFYGATLMGLGADNIGMADSGNTAIVESIYISGEDIVVTTIGKVAQMSVYDNMDLDVTVDPADSTVFWFSDNSRVVSVDHITGEVKAEARGSATITAVAGGICDTVMVTVVNE